MKPALIAQFRVDYGAFNLDVSLNLPGSGISVLFGHSGSGKTTLLRCIAGLQHPPLGFLEINGALWQDSGRKLFLPPYRRPLGYVFQEANLFPHLTVLGNLHFGMKRANGDQTALDQAIALLGIDHLLARKPDRLSGGERQRVAIARALVVRPQILLMDEPLAALDWQRKQEILPFLERLHGALSIPIAYVTHSADEVARLADHLVVLDQGKAVASGTLQETLARLDLPVRIGKEAGVVLAAKVTEKDGQWQLALAEFPGGRLWVRDRDFYLGQAVRLQILAQDVSLALSPTQDSSILNSLPCTIEDFADGEHPAIKLARVAIGESRLLCRLTHRSVQQLGLVAGKQVWAQIKSAALVE